MNISIVIPTLNEEAKLSQLLDVITSNTYKYEEIIIVDASSSDKTVAIAKKYPKTKIIENQLPSRAEQMNTGAIIANGDIIYFIHADVIPPITFKEDIVETIEKGADFGCYRFQFDKKTLPMRFNSWWTQFDFMFCRGGDQTLFVKSKVFNKMNGFDPEYVIMEDFEFIKRVRKKYKFKIMSKSVIVSTRKYNYNSYLKVNIINLLSYWMFMFGISPVKIKKFYKKNLKNV